MFRSPRLAFRLVLAALMASSSAGASAQTTLTISSWVPPTHTLTETQKEWCQMLEQKVAGKIKCNMLPRAISAPPGTFDAVRHGLADLSFTVHGYTPGRFVTTQMAEVPFLGQSAEATSVAFQRMYQKYILSIRPAASGERNSRSVDTGDPGCLFRRGAREPGDPSGVALAGVRRCGELRRALPSAL